MIYNVGERATAATCDACVQKELDETLQTQEKDIITKCDKQTFINNKHNIKLNKMEDKKMTEKKYQIVERLLKEGKTVEQIITETGIKSSYVKTAARNFNKKNDKN